MKKLGIDFFDFLRNLEGLEPLIQHRQLYLRVSLLLFVSLLLVDGAQFLLANAIVHPGLGWNALLSWLLVAAWTLITRRLRWLIVAVALSSLSTWSYKYLREDGLPPNFWRLLETICVVALGTVVYQDWIGCSKIWDTHLASDEVQLNWYLACHAITSGFDYLVMAVVVVVFSAGVLSEIWTARNSSMPALHAEEQ